MARANFGAGVSDFVFTSTAGGLLRLTTATLTFWDAETGGTQHTDLLFEGSPVTQISVPADGQVPTFQGPDAVYQMWASAGGPRVLIDSHVVGGPTNEQSASFVTSPGPTKDALSATIATAVDGLDAAPKLPTLVAAVTNIETTSTPRVIDHHGGYFWGTTSENKIMRSADGDTWAEVAAPGFRPSRILPCADGEMVVVLGSQIRKSSGWANNPATATWSTKVTTTGAAGAIANFGFDSDSTGTKFIAIEYGPDRTLSNKVYISLNAGTTWFTAYDTQVQWPTEYANSHVHSCCYDEEADRFWFSQGHNVPRGLYYSDDDGATWTKMPAEVYNPDGAPLTMVATKHGIVCGSDSNEAILFIIPRDPDPTRMRLQILARWKGATSGGAPGAPPRAFKDVATGLVYNIWSNAGDTTYPAPIMVTDGLLAREIYSTVATVVGRHIVVHDGVLRASWTQNTTQEMQLKALAGGDHPGEAVTNGGNIAYGTAGTQSDTAVGAASSATASQSVAVGTKAVAGLQSTVVGASATATGTLATVVGQAATAAGSSVAVGRLANASGATSIAIGRATTALASSVVIGDTSSATGNQATVVGDTATAATSAVAVGNDSNASGTGSMALGNTAAASGGSAIAVGSAASATGASAVALGQSATAPGGSSVIIGKSAVGTTSANTVAIGNTASVAATAAVAIGNGAAANNARSVALGDASVTTATDQLALGARHIELTALAADPAAPAATKVRGPYVKDNGAGKLAVYFRFPTGAVQVVATEP